MSLEDQKARLAAKVSRLPDGEAKERARLHLAEVERVLKGGRPQPAAPLPKPPKE